MTHGALGFGHFLGATWFALEEDKEALDYGMLGFHLGALAIDLISAWRHMKR